MASLFLKLLFLTALIAGSAIVSFAQSDLPDASDARPGRPRRQDLPLGLKEMLAKQKAERDKKEHEELLERGDEALRLANQLETSFATQKTLSNQDKYRLESLEKLVSKIRKELGGDDDGDRESDELRATSETRPSNLEEAFKYLQSATIKLVDELKKTTRFSISAVAIQSSNTVLKLVRFLRLRK